MASASKMLGDAALLCLLPGLEQTSLSSAGIYVTTASCLHLVVHRNGDLLQFLSPVNQLHSLFVPFFSQLTFSILLLFEILHCFRSLSPPKIKCST